MEKQKPIGKRHIYRKKTPVEKKSNEKKEPIEKKNQ